MNVDELWKAYWDAGKPVDLRNELVELHLDRAQRAAQAVARKFPGVQVGDALSIASEALMRAVESWEPPKGASFRTWSYVAMRNALSTWRRSQARQTRRLCYSDMVDSQAATPSAADVAIQREDRRAVERAITQADGIDLRVRVVLYLRYVAGATLDGVGGVLGLCPERVRQLETRGVLAVRDLELRRREAYKTPE